MRRAQPLFLSGVRAQTCRKFCTRSKQPRNTAPKRQCQRSKYRSVIVDFSCAASLFRRRASPHRHRCTFRFAVSASCFAIPLQSARGNFALRMMRVHALFLFRHPLGMLQQCLVVHRSQSHRKKSLWHSASYSFDHAVSLDVLCISVETVNSGNMREFGISLTKKNKTTPDRIGKSSTHSAANLSPSD